MNKEPTCFENYAKPSCINLFLTNCSKSFESTLTIETNVLDFFKLMGNVLKVKHNNVLPKIMQYRDYINFDSTRFFEKLQVMFFNLNMNILNFGSLKKCFLELLLLKRKFPRANHSEFVTKEVLRL